MIAKMNANFNFHVLVVEKRRKYNFFNSKLLRFCIQNMRSNIYTYVYVSMYVCVCVCVFVR